MYEVAANIQGVEIIRVPLEYDKGFTLDIYPRSLKKLVMYKKWDQAMGHEKIIYRSRRKSAA